MKKIALFLTAILLYCSSVNAQTTTITTGAPGNTGYAGDIWIGPGSTITFVVQNNNSHDIILTNLEDFKSTAGPGFPLNPAGFYLWYSTTSLSGDPGQIIQPIWSKLGADTAQIVNMVPGYNTVFSNLNFLIPANTTYRFALQCTTGIAYSGNSSPNILTKDSVSLILGSASNAGFAGNYPNSSYNNSYFTGSISFQSAVPCTSPPNAGTAISSVTDTCSGIPFILDLSGYSGGLGQTFQWQKSLNGTNWSSMIGDTTSSTTTSQALSTFYRCAVTCSANTAYSIPVQVNTPIAVSGNYTINKALPTSGNNFQSFTEAINYVSCGINGPVVFTVVPGSGPYQEQVTIPFIGGTSSINTITFKCKGENLNMTAGTTSNLPVITLNNADHIIIDSLIIDCSTSPYGWGILLTNKADSNVIKNCTIINEFASTSMFAHNGILINGSNQTLSASGNNGNYNLITNNTIIGGTYGVYIWGAGLNNAQNVGNKIINNNIKEFYSYGVSVNYAPTGTVVNGNDFIRSNRSITTSTCGAIYIGTGCSSTLVEKNRIHNLFDAMSSTIATVYAINITGSGTIGQENKVINNLVYNMNGNANNYGIYNNTASNMQAYHNTIIFDDAVTPTGASYGLAQAGGGTGISFKNNLVYITRGGTGNQRCINYANNTGSIISNHNVLYINCPTNAAAKIGLYGNTSFTTLADWRLANNSAFDQQSVSVNPVFSSTPNEYIPTAAAINDIGEDLGITEDILVISRSNYPDPGAYEFTAAVCNNVITAGTAVSSVANICPDKTFALELTGNSLGAGQNYQWQSSANNTNWTNVGSASPNPMLSVSQTNSNYYRCAIQCGTGAFVYSTSVQITTPSYLSGNYTINQNAPASSSNYQSFTAAINSIQCGINGPVVFNVVPGSGPYVEHFTIPQIAGSSATNTLTINGNGETLEYSSTDATNKTAIILNGADHIIIDSLTINVASGTYSWAMIFTNQADSNTIRKCTITGNTIVNNQNSMGIVFNGATTALNVAGNNGNYNTITDNTIVGGYYSIYMYGTSGSTTQNLNNTIKNNIFKDMFTYSIYASYQPAGLVISGNDFSRPTRTNSSAAAGVYINTGTFGALIEKNRVHNLFDAQLNSTQQSYGFFIGSDPSAAKANRVINNLVYNMNGNGSITGIMCTFGNNCKIYHNTIVLDDQVASTTSNATTLGISQRTQATGIDIRNNLVFINRSGISTKNCLDYGSTASSIISNHNILYMAATGGTSNNIGTVQATAYPTLANWQAANNSAYDQQSVNANPIFANTAIANYQPTNASLVNIGDSLAVTTDIIGTVRNNKTPDAGAYEFASILPVTSLSLKGERVGNINKIQWTTLTENNCLGFELLRSNTNNGNDFSSVGFISSKAINGNSTALLLYNFDDAAATAINTYYRLKQLDKDGNFSYSNTILVKATKAAALEIVSIYPNPVANQLNVVISSPNYRKATIVIADVFGKNLISENVSLNAGDNTATLIVNQLAAGTYTLKLVCDNGCETTVKKFVKR
jgi:hypothetical protein